MREVSFLVFEEKTRRIKNYAGIDYFRLLAALMVIAIHIGPFSYWNHSLDFLLTYCLGRIAVPFFFMTTGYFVLAPYVFSDFQKKTSIRKYLLKSGRLYLVSILLYLPINLYSGKVPHSIGEVIKEFLFDGTFYHLWYFPAAMLGCILLVFLMKKSIKAAFLFSVIAYVVGLLGDSYYGIVKTIPLLHSIYDGIFSISSYTRNGIFFAPIFLFLGFIVSIPQFRCSKFACKSGVVISLLLMVLEGLITYYLKLQKHNSMYLFLIPTMFFLFQLLLMAPGKAPSWLRNGSMMLYVIHPAVLVFLRGIANVTGLTKPLIENTLIQYLSVCGLSLAFVFIMQFFITRRNYNVSKRTSLD